LSNNTTTMPPSEEPSRPGRRVPAMMWDGLQNGLPRGDAGMSTAEYAVGTVAAVAFAGLLLRVVTSPTVQQALTGIIDRALNS
jgi:hypothetical protein